MVHGRRQQHEAAHARHQRDIMRQGAHRPCPGFHRQGQRQREDADGGQLQDPADHHHHHACQAFKHAQQRGARGIGQAAHRHGENGEKHHAGQHFSASGGGHDIAGQDREEEIGQGRDWPGGGAGAVGQSACGGAWDWPEVQPQGHDHHRQRPRHQIKAQDPPDRGAGHCPCPCRRRGLHDAQHQERDDQRQDRHLQAFEPQGAQRGEPCDQPRRPWLTRHRQAHRQPRAQRHQGAKRGHADFGKAEICA
jgi:hypothetical protein